MIGAGVNSDLGVTGQIVISEQNFAWNRPPTSWDDVWQYRSAFRGGGQNFRLEATPGTEVQRYLVSWSDPYVYLFDLPLILNLSASYYQRSFYDWDEQRVSGRIGVGYRLADDLSLGTSLSVQDVKITDPRVPGDPSFDPVLGSTDLYIAGVSLTHDTRDHPFLATEGHVLQLELEQGFGEFDFPRATAEFRKYFLLHQRPDGSGSHTLSFQYRTGFTGAQTPLFEKFQAGGFTTFRGFDVRGASPKDAFGVAVGGDFMFLGTAEYTMPISANDMLRGVLFCDFGTVEPNVELHSDTYRVTLGCGLRIMIPGVSPAPIALDLGFPVAHAPGDDLQVFQFSIDVGR